MLRSLFLLELELLLPWPFLASHGILLLDGILRSCGLLFVIAKHLISPIFSHHLQKEDAFEMHTQSERGEGELKEMKRKMEKKSPTRRYLQGCES